jgi:hypothetical protein
MSEILLKVQAFIAYHCHSARRVFLIALGWGISRRGQQSEEIGSIAWDQSTEPCGGI